MSFVGITCLVSHFLNIIYFSFATENTKAKIKSTFIVLLIVIIY